MSQTGCGFVVEFKYNIETRRFNRYEAPYDLVGTGNRGGWEYSDLRAYLNGKIYNAEGIDYSTTGLINKLPSDLRNHLALTNAISGHGAVDSSNCVTQDKIWVPAHREVLGSYIDHIADYDVTRQLDYYSLSGVKITRTTQARKTMQGGSENVSWWLRTGNTYTSPYFYAVSNSNDVHSPAANLDRGISPAFKLK